MIKVPMIPVECGTCGKMFLKRPCWVRKSSAHFCSRRCNGKQRIKAAIPSAHLGRKNWTEESMVSYRAKMSGPNNPAWKGGVTYWRKRGNYKPIKYVRCPAEFAPMARKDGYIMEHRLVMAKRLGRLLQRTEVVHHINHDPHDNRPENLELFASNGEHKRVEWARLKSARLAAS